MTYTYSATQNNGRIVSSADAVTGENVSYTYDSLNRLIAAATSGTTGVQWGDSYSYDGFGNLTSKVVTKGTAPQVYPQVSSATNQARMSGDYGFDANGNWMGSGGSQINTWNVENQLISSGSVDYSGNLLTYTYDPWGKRVMQYSVGGVSGPTGTLYFYSITGQRLGIYGLDYLVAGQTSVNMYFGRRLLAAVDRLGSVRGNKNGAIAYYPWGEERTSTPDGADKFATYFRDSSVAGVGEDYANARYYNNNFGRFWSVDPAGRADASDPQTWNQYGYARNDPTNRSDPTGLDPYCGPDEIWDGEGCMFGAGSSQPGQCGPDWISDAGFSGPCANPCPVGQSNLLPNNTPNPACYYAGPPTGPAPTPTPTCSDWSCMPAAFARAVQALTLNTQCMDLFGTAKTRAGKFDPVIVLTNIVFGPNTLGHIQFEDEGPTWGVAETYPSGHLPIPGLAGSVSITINEYTDQAGSLYWNAGNTTANAETLLHELAHAFNFIRGSGGFAISNLSEFGNPSAFDNLINQECF